MNGVSTMQPMIAGDRGPGIQVVASSGVKADRRSRSVNDGSLEITGAQQRKTWEGKSEICARNGLR
ncbi:MAG: hypothetical protein AUI63_01870 [Gemmatimonadetes bacterium 13_1_40CM_2_60_3]|nr:MAG: hypothetical protein AUI63_01870 [Gemmatimonadetes bacterium 13_1_40CM_2_60_3]